MPSQQKPDEIFEALDKLFTGLANSLKPSPPITHDHFQALCASGEMLHGKQFACGGYAGIRTFPYSSDIVADLTEEGYNRRWSFKTEHQAKIALDAWTDYSVSPDGWHREVHTGDRRDEQGNHIGNW